MADNYQEDLYNTTPCFFFSFNAEGFITRINLPFLNKLEYTIDEFAGIKKIAEILTVGSRIFFQTHFHPLIMLHGKADEIFLSFQSKSKQEIPVLLNVIKTEQPGVNEYHCGGMQIAQRNSYEKAILEAKHVAEKALYDNEELGRMKMELEHNRVQLEKRLQNLTRLNLEHQQITRVISHDLQEPLRKLSLFSDKIMERSAVLLHPKLLETLLKINRASVKIRELVLKMQQFLTIDQEQFNPVKINLGNAFKVAVQKSGIISGDPSINISLPEIPPVKADFDLIVNLFYELISNSLKFRNDHLATLEIKVTAELIEKNIYKEINNKYRYANFLRITYSDNGIGFDQAYMPNVFALFIKASPVEKGPGIGLAYCKKIIDLHQGEISVRSETGKGTTFTLLLPAYDVDNILTSMPFFNES